MSCVFPLCTVWRAGSVDGGGESCSANIVLWKWATIGYPSLWGARIPLETRSDFSYPSKREWVVDNALFLLLFVLLQNQLRSRPT